MWNFRLVGEFFNAYLRVVTGRGLLLDNVLQLNREMEGKCILLVSTFNIQRARDGDMENKKRRK